MITQIYYLVNYGERHMASFLLCYSINSTLSLIALILTRTKLNFRDETLKITF